jgi:DNA-binding CsgD family transcriptional regulator
VTLDLLGSWYRGVVLALEAQGVDVATLIGDVKRPFSKDGRSAWDELVELLERTLARHGDGLVKAAMQDFAARHSTMRLSAELLCSPRFTYLVFLEGLSAAQAQLLVSHEASPTALSVRLELHRAVPPSRPLLQCLAWILAAVPRSRGLADARVHSEHLGDRELELVLVPPPDPGFCLTYPDGAARTLARELFRLHAPAAPPPPETPAPPNLQLLQTRFALTRAEARVVKLLAEGRSMKRIAEELDVSLETARTHAKRAMQKTDTHRQAELVSLVLQGRRRREE